jgi:hypothetical protein
VSAGRLRPFLALAAAVLGLGLLQYAPTFASSFAGDDIDYLSEAADVRAGAVGLGTVLFRPHHEHLVPALRLAVQASVALFGASALPLRLTAFLAHSAAALFLGLLARRYARRDASMVAAGAAAMASGGFSSLVVWFPTAAFVPVALAGIAGASAALAWQERLGTVRARVLAVFGISLALGSESTFAPLVAFPLLVNALERRAAGKRAVSAFDLLVLAGSAAWLLASREIFMRLTGRLFVLDLRHGLPRALFLLLAAPYRLVFPGAPLPVPPGTEGLLPFVACLAGLALAVAFAAFVRRGLAREHRPLLAVFAASLVVCGFLVLLAGLGRARFAYWELYDADRYFYPLLPAVALGAALLVETWPEGRPRGMGAWALAGFVAAEVLLQARAVSKRFPSVDYATHERRFDEMAAFSRAVGTRAAALPAAEPPLAFPDVSFTFEDVHNGRLSVRLAFFVAGTLPPRVVLVGPRVSARDEALLNPALEDWARRSGEALPFWVLEGGELVDARRPFAADFRARPESRAIVEGFSEWEASLRWMGPEGVLRLVLAGPRLDLMVQAAALEKLPGRTLTLAISLEAGPDVVRLEPLSLPNAEVGEQTRAVPPDFLARHRGEPVLLRLASDRSFDAAPGAGPPMRRSVRVYRATLTP